MSLADTKLCMVNNTLDSVVAALNGQLDECDEIGSSTLETISGFPVDRATLMSVYDSSYRKSEIKDSFLTKRDLLSDVSTKNVKAEMVYQKEEMDSLFEPLALLDTVHPKSETYTKGVMDTSFMNPQNYYTKSSKLDFASGDLLIGSDIIPATTADTDIGITDLLKMNNVYVSNKVYLSNEDAIGVLGNTLQVKKLSLGDTVSSCSLVPVSGNLFCNVDAANASVNIHTMYATALQQAAVLGSLRQYISTMEDSAGTLFLMLLLADSLEDSSSNSIHGTWLTPAPVSSPVYLQTTVTLTPTVLSRNISYIDFANSRGVSFDCTNFSPAQFAALGLSIAFWGNLPLAHNFPVFSFDNKKFCLYITNGNKLEVWANPSFEPTSFRFVASSCVDFVSPGTWAHYVIVIKPVSVSSISTLQVLFYKNGNLSPLADYGFGVTGSIDAGSFATSAIASNAFLCGDGTNTFTNTCGIGEFLVLKRGLETQDVINIYANGAASIIYGGVLKLFQAYTDYQAPLSQLITYDPTSDSTELEMYSHIPLYDIIYLNLAFRSATTIATDVYASYYRNDLSTTGILTQSTQFKVARNIHTASQVLYTVPTPGYTLRTGKKEYVSFNQIGDTVAICSTTDVLVYRYAAGPDAWQPAGVINYAGLVVKLNKEGNILIIQRDYNIHYCTYLYSSGTWHVNTTLSSGLGLVSASAFDLNAYGNVLACSNAHIISVYYAKKTLNNSNWTWTLFKTGLPNFTLTDATKQINRVMLNEKGNRLLIITTNTVSGTAYEQIASVYRVDDSSKSWVSPETLFLTDGINNTYDAGVFKSASPDFEVVTLGSSVSSTNYYVTVYLRDPVRSQYHALYIVAHNYTLYNMQLSLAEGCLLVSYVLSSQYLSSRVSLFPMQYQESLVLAPPLSLPLPAIEPYAYSDTPLSLFTYSTTGSVRYIGMSGDGNVVVLNASSAKLIYRYDVSSGTFVSFGASITNFSSGTLSKTALSYDGTQIVISDPNFVSGTTTGRGLYYAYSVGSNAWVLKYDFRPSGTVAISPGGDMICIHTGQTIKLHRVNTTTKDVIIDGGTVLTYTTTSAAMQLIPNFRSVLLYNSSGPTVFTNPLLSNVAWLANFANNQNLRVESRIKHLSTASRAGVYNSGLNDTNEDGTVFANFFSTGWQISVYKYDKTTLQTTYNSFSLPFSLSNSSASLKLNSAGNILVLGNLNYYLTPGVSSTQRGIVQVWAQDPGTNQWSCKKEFIGGSSANPIGQFVTCSASGRVIAFSVQSGAAKVYRLNLD